MKDIHFDGSARILLKNSSETGNFDAAMRLGNLPITEIKKHVTFADIPYMNFFYNLAPVRPTDLKEVKVYAPNDIHKKTKQNIDSVVFQFISSPSMPQFLSGVLTSAGLRSLDKYFKSHFPSQDFPESCDTF
jgi:hypothetical protein